MRNEELMKKWAPILEHNALPAISDSHREAVTATLLENTEASIQEGSSLGGTGVLSEAAPANSTASAANYEPVLISLVRRAMPNLVAYDIVGVQPMTGPTGLIFAMKSKYASTDAGVTSGNEALFGEANTSFSGGDKDDTTDLGHSDNTDGSANVYKDQALATGQGNVDGNGNLTGVDTGEGRLPGQQESTDGSGDINEMSFAIEKVSVTARSRALKAEYTSELAQDLKAIHGLDAETELANILSTEILAEINREVVRTVYTSATPGATDGNTAAKGQFNLDVDANGRW